jgi:cell wall assembly regulator SMI1
MQTHREVEVMMEAGIEEGLILWPQLCQADGASGGHSRPVQRNNAAAAGNPLTPFAGCCYRSTASSILRVFWVA